MKKIYLLALGLATPFISNAQSAIDAFRLAQPDMKGTARYMGMGGAFGALGGDLSSISTNPAGIGVYRRSEIGATMDIDIQNTSAMSQGIKGTQDQTKILLNNIGGVTSWNLGNSIMPNVNIGFTYNRSASFNSHYIGGIPQLSSSLSNYIAGFTNSYGLNEDNLRTEFDNNNQITFDPYYDPYGSDQYGPLYAPWISILGYDSYFITPTGDKKNTEWIGQWGNGTSGSGRFEVLTSGAVNEYNIAIGGNVYNKLFWGIDCGIVDLNYSMSALWQENLQNAVVDNPSRNPNTSANWNMLNRYNVKGTGYNIKLGLIYRPIQELRLGISASTPTWYTINENFIATTNFDYPEINIPDQNDPDDFGQTTTNGGLWGVNAYNFRTPWRLTTSAAAVIGKNLIVSADLEWNWYGKMRFYDANDDSYWEDDDYYYPLSNDMSMIDPDPWYQSNADIENYYKTTTTIRVGAEYRVTPRFSIRAGYANVSSPVRKENVSDPSKFIFTTGTMPNFTWQNSTNYITCGIGYNFNHFYIDAAYVNKTMSSEYHAYSHFPAMENYSQPFVPSQTAKVDFTNHQIVLSAGYKF